MKKTVEEKYGRRTRNFTLEYVRQNSTANRKGQIFDLEAETNHRSNTLNPDEFNDSDLNRNSYNSQNSLDVEPTGLARARHIGKLLI